MVNDREGIKFNYSKRNFSKNSFLRYFCWKNFFNRHNMNHSTFSHQLTLVWSSVTEMRKFRVFQSIFSLAHGKVLRLFYIFTLFSLNFSTISQNFPLLKIWISCWQSLVQYTLIFLYAHEKFNSFLVWKYHINCRKNRMNEDFVWSWADEAKKKSTERARRRKERKKERQIRS